MLEESGERYQSLYEGLSAQVLADAAPYLVALRADSDLLRYLAFRAWGQSWAVFLTCRSEFDELRKHLRQFLKVKLDTGMEVYFRFYDPRVLRLFLPTSSGDDCVVFFGPVTRFLTEDESSKMVLEFTKEGQWVQLRQTQCSLRANVDFSGP